MMSEVFNQLGQYFHQDIHLIYSSVEEVAKAFIQRLDKSETKELVVFIETKLSASSDSELADLWDETGSDIIVDDHAIRDFLSKILGQAKSQG